MSRHVSVNGVAGTTVPTNIQGYLPTFPFHPLVCHQKLGTWLQALGKERGVEIRQQAIITKASPNVKETQGKTQGNPGEKKTITKQQNREREAGPYPAPVPKCNNNKREAGPHRMPKGSRKATRPTPLTSDRHEYAPLSSRIAVAPASNRNSVLLRLGSHPVVCGAMPCGSRE